MSYVYTLGSLWASLAAAKLHGNNFYVQCSVVDPLYYQDGYGERNPAGMDPLERTTKFLLLERYLEQT